jgi:hypothetical protein
MQQPAGGSSSLWRQHVLATCGRHPCEHQTHSCCAHPPIKRTGGKIRPRLCCSCHFRTHAHRSNHDSLAAFCNGPRCRLQHSLLRLHRRASVVLSLVAKRPKRWWSPLCATSSAEQGRPLALTVVAHVPSCAAVPARWSVSMTAPNVSTGAVAERCISHGRSLAIAAEPSYRTSMGWLAAMA